MFLLYLREDPHHFVFVVVTMVLSVVAHELAHGWAAIRLGDRTPIELGHMTIDPRVHMGTASLLMLLAFGICYGAMPVDPSRLRGRHGAAIVAAAGPLANLLLAFVAVTAFALWSLAGGDEAPSLEGENLRRFFWTFGYCNLALAVFNLIPIPPLDGSTVLATLSRGYARLLERVRSPVVFVAAFMLVWSVLSSDEHGVYTHAADAATAYAQWIYALAGR